MMVLIIDSSDLVRDRLKNVLVDLTGVCVVGHAADMRRGLELATQLKPDVVLMDIWTPEGGGLQWVRAIKKLDPAPSVIVATNDADAELRQMCRRSGADVVFDKSAQLEEMVSLFRSLVGESELQ